MRRLDHSKKKKKKGTITYQFKDKVGPIKGPDISNHPASYIFRYSADYKTSGPDKVWKKRQRC